MDKREKKELYDKICRELTNYEHSESTPEVDKGDLEEFYFLLVEIQNKWEELTNE